MSKPEKKKDNLEAILEEYEKIALDLSEVTIGVDLEWQTERVEKNNDRFKILIHGGGTGQE